MSIEWVCTGGPFGDCTSHYVGRLRNKVTIKDFIEHELNSHEWGILQINGKIVCKYDHGILFDADSNLLQHYLSTEIKSIESSGGWSLMDYVITVEEPEQEENGSQKSLYITFDDGFNF